MKACSNTDIAGVWQLDLKVRRNERQMRKRLNLWGRMLRLNTRTIASYEIALSDAKEMREYTLARVRQYAGEWEDAYSACEASASRFALPAATATPVTPLAIAAE
jgi:hypothetical protein